jgi:phosphate butyryltransferase
MVKSIKELIEKAKKINSKTVVVACAADEHVLEAVELARKENIINGILVGNVEIIKEILTTLNIDSTNYTYVKILDKTESCLEAVKIVNTDKDFFLMKGLVDTSIILRAALNKEFGLRTNNRISHVSVIEVSTHPKLIFMSDGAMNIKPTLDEKRQIIENSIVIANALGLETPKVGIIAAVEKVNPQMEATLDAVELIKMNKENILNGCIVGGPFAIDNAINKEAAILKGVSDPIAGDVDILIMPQIESGNVFYKSMMFLGKAQSASVIAGAKKPIVLTSRADSTLNKFHSIALGALVVDL